jgi:uncharacterized repeat protein (TIGR01451 family)
MSLFHRRQPPAIAAVTVALLIGLQFLPPTGFAAPAAVVTPGTEIPTPSTVPPTATRVPPTATRVPPTEIPPTATALPPTAEPTPVPTVAGYVDLQLATTIDNPAPQLNDIVRLTLNLGNRGTAGARDVVVAVDLPAGLELLSIEGWGGDWSREGNRVLLWVREVNPYAAFAITLVTRAAGSGELAVSAAVTTSNSDDPIVDNSAQQLLAVAAAPVATAPAASVTPLPETNFGLNLSPPLLAMLAGTLLAIRALSRSSGARERLRRPPQ